METDDLKTQDFEAEKIRRQGDKIIVTALWFLSLYPFAVEPWLGGWLGAVAVGFPAAILPTITAGQLRP
jgi:hypothetical protein